MTAVKGSHMPSSFADLGPLSETAASYLGATPVDAGDVFAAELRRRQAENDVVVASLAGVPVVRSRSGTRHRPGAGPSPAPTSSILSLLATWQPRQRAPRSPTAWPT